LSFAEFWERIENEENDIRPNNYQDDDYRYWSYDEDSEDEFEEEWEDDE